MDIEYERFEELEELEEQGWKKYFSLVVGSKEVVVLSFTNSSNLHHTIHPSFFTHYIHPILHACNSIPTHNVTSIIPTSVTAWINKLSHCKSSIPNHLFIDKPSFWSFISNTPIVQIIININCFVVFHLLFYLILYWKSSLSSTIYIPTLGPPPPSPPAT